MSDNFVIKVRLASGELVSLQVPSENTPISEVKRRLAEHTQLPVQRMRLLFNSSILADDQNLESYGIEQNAVLRLIQLANNESTARDVSGIRGASAQHQTPAAQAMNNPILQMMMSNPQFAQNMMSMHPQLRRAMDENPELRNMINDPEMLRQTMHAASNPMLMQELQRSNDRALANLEAMPGGLAQIRRIYNNFQEPMTPGPMGGPPESLEMLNARRARVMGVKIPDRNAVNTSPLPNPWARRPRRATAPAPAAAAAAARSGAGAGASSRQSMPQAYARQGMHTSLNDQVSRNAERLAQLNLSSPGGSAQQRQQQQHQQQQQQLQAARNVMAENPFGLSSYPPSDAFGLFQPAFRPGASGIQQQQQQQAPPQMSSMYMTNPDASASSSATAAPVQHQQQHLNTAPGHTISEAERASLRQRFQSELSQLEEMGFLDQDKNLRALSVTNGDLSLALNLIAEDD